MGELARALLSGHRSEGPSVHEDFGPWGRRGVRRAHRRGGVHGCRTCACDGPVADDGLPREDFYAAYGEMLLCSCRCIATPVGADWTTLKEQALPCAWRARASKCGGSRSRRRPGRGGAVRMVIQGPDEMQGGRDVTDMGLLGDQSVPIWAATEGRYWLLVGMPACGLSAAKEATAEWTGRRFYR